MKKLMKMKRKSGQGMTEYIIIIAIIAVGAIIIVGIFGAQIKEVFSGIGGALGGQDSKSGDLSGKLDAEAETKESMKSYDEQKQGDDSI